MILFSDIDITEAINIAQATGWRPEALRRPVTMEARWLRVGDLVLMEGRVRERTCAVAGIHVGEVWIAVTFDHPDLTISYPLNQSVTVEQ